MVYSATWGCGDILPGLLVRTMSESTVLQKSGSEFLSVFLVITVGYMDAMQSPETVLVSEAHVVKGTRLLPKAKSWSVFLLQLGSALMCMAQRQGAI